MSASKKAAKRVSTPREANTGAKICAMPRDSWSYGDFWMMVSETEVHLYHQKMGEPPVGKVSIPKRAFNRFVDAYNTGKSRAPDVVKASLRKRPNRHSSSQGGR